MIYTTKEDGKTILWGMTTDDKDDAYETVTDKNDVVIFRQVDTGKDFVYNEGEWYEFAESGGGGGGGGVLIVNDVSGTLDKTWKEIYDATTGGKLCLISVTNNGFDILALITIIATDHDTMYGVGADNKQYETSTEDGYPVLNG